MMHRKGMQRHIDAEYPHRSDAFVQQQPVSRHDHTTNHQTVLAAQLMTMVNMSTVDETIAHLSVKSNETDSCTGVSTTPTTSRTKCLLLRLPLLQSQSLVASVEEKG